MTKAFDSSNRPLEEQRPARLTQPLHELLAAFNSTDEVPPMDTAYWRRAGKVIAEAAAKKALFWRAKRKD
jgi:hypothetical protein